jgi:hypothetical protein
LMPGSVGGAQPGKQNGAVFDRVCSLQWSNRGRTSCEMQPPERVKAAT